MSLGGIGLTPSPLGEYVSIIKLDLFRNLFPITLDVFQNKNILDLDKKLNAKKSVNVIFPIRSVNAGILIFF
jgi:hypothetical protein